MMMKTHWNRYCTALLLSALMTLGGVADAQAHNDHRGCPPGQHRGWHKNHTSMSPQTRQVLRGALIGAGVGAGTGMILGRSVLTPTLLGAGVGAGLGALQQR